MTLRARPAWFFLALCTAVAPLTGCGYSATETFAGDYRTVSLPIFENRTFYKGVEYDLAEALTKEVEARTPYRVSRPGSADTILEGRIIAVTQRLASRTRDAGLPEVMEVVVTVEFQWKDLRSGEMILDRKGFSAVGQYVPTTPLGEPFIVAQHDAVARLATDIVDTMRSPW